MTVALVPAVRSGWASARGRASDLRWRRWSLAIGAAAATATLCLTLGLLAMHQRTADRVRGRSLGPRRAGPTSMTVHLGTDTLGGRQWTVVWVMPDPGAPTPPGVTTWPAPGTFAVSPALARAIREDGTLAARYARYSVIGDLGVHDRSEWFAYAVPRRATAFTGATYRAGGFGTGAASNADDGRSPNLTVVLATAVCLLGPLLLLLRVSLTTGSLSRRRRAATLDRLGAPTAHLRAVAVVETLPATTAGALLGLAAATIWSTRTGHVPCTGQAIVPGDLRPPWWQAGAVAAIVIAGTVGAAATASRRGRERARPTRSRVGPSRVLAVPALAGAALLALVARQPAGAVDATVTVMTTVLLLTGVPLALPLVAAGIGRTLASAPTPVLQLAGRRIEADPAMVVRPLLGAGALVFALLVAAGYVAAVSADDPPPVLDRHLDAATVLSFDRSPAAQRRFARALPTDVVAASSEDETTVRLGTTCSALARVLPRPCGDEGRISRATESRLLALTGRPTDGSTRIRLGAPGAPPPGAGRFTLVIGPRRPDLTRRVEVAAARTLLAPEVSTVANLRPRASGLWGWIRLGLVVVASISGLAVVIGMGDRFATAGRRQHLLHLIGVDGGRVRRLEAAQVLVIWAASIGVSFAAGLANALAMARTAPGSHLPAELVAAAGIVAVITAAVGVAATDLATRAATRQRA